MKRNKIAIFALLLVLAMLLASCGEYSPALKQPGGTQGGDQPQTPPVGGGEVSGEEAFTVKMTYEGKTFIPDPQKPIRAQWSDGFSFHSAEIGADGTARITGLDGDYRVTLSDVPEGYTYNPNVYMASNNSRAVEIKLYKIVTTRGKGSGLYNCIEIKSTGLYRVELSKASAEVFYEFAPRKSGTYSVEAWVDTTQNNVNPQANYYGANAFFKRLEYTADDGGAESSFTKNFKLDVEIADEMIGDNGQVTFSFGIKATAKNGEYPAVVYFAITLDGEFSLNFNEPTLMIPQETLVHQPYYDPEKYDFVGAEFAQTQNGNTALVFDSDNYKLWRREDGGDGYYHLYKPDAYPETGGYGPILYAYISQPCRFIDASFDTIEMRGNKALTLSNGTENYKLFIEGFDALLVDPPGDNGPYFCVTNCPCRTSNRCAGACTDACTECHVDCRRCPEEAMGKGGYSDYVNTDGCYGVTQELKEFLQKYSINQLLFMDGNGFVETNPSVSVYALEQDQWLFACGYYREK